MFWILAPIITLATKKYVAAKVSEAIFNGRILAAAETRKKAEFILSKNFNERFTCILFSVISLLFLVFFSPRIFGDFISKNLIVSVYISMLLDGFINMTKSAPFFCKLIFEHKLNLLDYIKKKIYDEVYSHAYSKASYDIERTFIIFRPFIYFFGQSASDVAHEIAKSTAYSESRIILRVTCQKTFLLLAFLALNSSVFVTIVAPFLSIDLSGFNYFEVIIHPYFFSVEKMWRQFT
jgi:hypothetical protein